MPAPGKLEFNGARPGERLRLLTIEKDVAPLKARLGCLGVISVSLIGIAGGAYSATQHTVQFLGVMALITFVAALLAGAVVFPSARLLTLESDWEAGRLCYFRGLPGHPPSKTASIEFSSIGSVAAEVSPGTPRHQVTDLPLRLTVRDLEGGSLLDSRLTVRDVDCETKLMDLLMRFGQAIGLAHYHVPVKNPMRFEMHVTRGREERSKTIPAITERADYAEDLIAEGIENRA